MLASTRRRLLTLALAFCTAVSASAATPGQGRFTGYQSCASSYCHGGGKGNDQCLIFQKKDVHTHAAEILANNRSTRIAEGLGLADATKDLRCTVCHSPVESVAPEHFVSAPKPEKGLSCETCHGPAENWLRFHTRKDISHEQRVGAGLRETASLYGRASVCVACHLNVDAQLVQAGHPEMFFELDGQMKNQPPHWKDEADAWFGPRAWLVGQATSLREVSWKLASQPTEDLQARWKALRWVLKQVPTATGLPEGAGDYRTVQSGADRVARAASGQRWTKEGTMTLLRKLAASNVDFRDAGIPPAEHRRRAELLVLGVDRLWQALKTAGSTSPTLETALGVAAGEAKKQTAFQPDRFAAALQQIEVALELLGK